ncbi:MAG TPA: hypothetical protein VHV50_14345, partial [Actinomycetota bacterium]|nr:hypothetical protein [Actinomycetota bacterium]
MGNDIERDAPVERNTAQPPPQTVDDEQARHGDLDRLRLRFRNPDLEDRFRTHFANHNITNLRIGHALGVVMWITWGFMVRNYLGSDRSFDLAVRYGVLIPLALIGLALTFLPHYPRFWKLPVMTVLLLTGLTWSGYVSEIKNVPPDYGYVGVILIQTFTFSILRLPFRLVALFDVITMPFYFAVALKSGDLGGLRTLLAIFNLGSFSLLGLIASYVLEWKIRKLFLRERQLDVERARSDTLLLNILPQVIIDRLKTRRALGRSERLADALNDVTVLFVDAVGFTEQAAKTQPDELVRSLDDLF